MQSKIWRHRSCGKSNSVIAWCDRKGFGIDNYSKWKKTDTTIWKIDCIAINLRFYFLFWTCKWLCGRVMCRFIKDFLNLGATLALALITVIACFWEVFCYCKKIWSIEEICVYFSIYLLTPLNSKCHSNGSCNWHGKRRCLYWTLEPQKLFYLLMVFNDCYIYNTPFDHNRTLY